MPTIITHALVPAAIAVGLGQRVIPARLAVAGAIAAMVPDLDVLGLRLGISSHRGFTHSLAFAAALAFWPFSDQRFFAPWRPIEVSPLGIRGFFGARGVEVLKSEVIWVWLPTLALALALFAARRRK